MSITDPRRDQHTAFTTTAEAAVLPDPGTGRVIDLTGVVVVNSSGTDVVVSLRSTAAGAVRHRIFAKAASNGGVVEVELPGDASQSWTAECSAGVSTVYVTAMGVERAHR